MKEKTIIARLDKAGFRLFDARPYPCVVLPYDISRKKHVAALRRLVPGGLQYDMKTCNGLCSSDTVEGYNLILVGVRMQHDDRHSILAHELYHTMSFIYRHCGVRHDTDNDEASAYFLQDLYRQALTALEGYGS